MNKITFFNLVKVEEGRRTLSATESGIIYWMNLKSPKRLVVDIEKRDDGYWSTLYMSEKDFKKTAGWFPQRKQNKKGGRRK